MTQRDTSSQTGAARETRVRGLRLGLRGVAVALDACTIHTLDMFLFVWLLVVNRPAVRPGIETFSRRFGSWLFLLRLVGCLFGSCLPYLI